MLRLKKLFAVILMTSLPVLGVQSASAVELQDVDFTDLKVGEGEEAVLGMRVVVHYTGWLTDGTQFDTSRETDSPFTFTLGTRQVIRGWDIGIQGMRVGGKRELVIPPELAYGKHEHPSGKIPANSTLKFEVELMEVGFNKHTNIEPPELAKMIERGVPIIDIRRPEEIKEVGKIEGSHNIPAFKKNQGFITTFFPSLKKIVKKTDEFVLICSNGRRAIYLGEIMADRKGYTKIHTVRKGMEKWINTGGAIVK